ncbi:MAG: cysteine desulfurase [Verrucomicrobia bacterium]|jgi:cysteine desulfurase/selenocysteine lyase|nr:cysteine desulfurase [Verrucomicrobiota bacterium]
MSTSVKASATKPDLASFRADFPILHQQVHGKPLIYFDNAATSQKPTSVIEALSRYYERDNANVHRGIHELSNRATAGFESARETAARFLHARSPNEIIFTRGATEGLNLVANAWGGSRVRAGDVILLTEMEHHSNLVPWQLLAERTGARLAFLPITGDDGRLDLSRVDDFLTSEVRLLAMVHISNSLGTINPVNELCARARKRGITTLIDAAQSAGHRRLDVQELDCDFLVLSGHKMCGPTGIGVLYGREALLNEMPPWQGGGEMILNVEYGRSTWKHAPHKFEAGTPDIAGAIGLAVAMDYLDHVGRDRIAQHDMELGAYAFARLSGLDGIRIFGPHVGRAGIVSFCLGDVHAHDVVELANQRGVALRGGHHCTQPLMRKLGVESTSRASFYFYNTTGEIDCFVEVIRDIQKFFSG